MARGNKPTDDAAMAEAQDLIAKLQAATTSPDLWKIGGTEEFKAAFAHLSEAAQKVLTDTFEVLDGNLKGKIKAEDVAAKWDEEKQTHVGGTVLNVPANGWTFPPPSPKYPNSRFVVIKGTREDTKEKFELLIGAMRVYRHFERAEGPQRIMLVQETPDEMRARDAKADTSPMWLVRNLNPKPVAKRSGGTPFG